MAKLKREHLLLGLLLLILVLLYLVSVAIGQDDGRPDPQGSKLEGLEGALGSLPGFGTELVADDVSTQCFDRASSSLTATSTRPCQFTVPDGIDRVRLARTDGQCDVEISNQPDVFDQSLPTTEWEDNRKQISLVGEGATITIMSRGQDGEPCSLRLNP